MALAEKLESFDPAKKVGSLLEEFKNFAFKGNVVDLAIGVIIGAAFGTIIRSLVDNVIMPLITFALPAESGYQTWKWMIGGHLEDGKLVGAKTIAYGQFLADVLNFLIVALVLFLFIKKFLGWLMRAKKEEAAAPPLTKDQQLLTDIRDLLKARAA